MLLGVNANFALVPGLAKLPASAYAGNKLVPRKQALEIMASSLNDLIQV